MKRNTLIVLVCGIAVMTGCGSPTPPTDQVHGNLRHEVTTLPPCDANWQCTADRRCSVLRSVEGDRALCFAEGQAPCDFLNCPAEYPSCLTFASLPSVNTCVRHGP